MSRVSAARTEPHAEGGGKRARKLRLFGESLLEFIVERPKLRLVVLRPAVVHHIAVKRSEPCILKALIHGGEGRFYIVWVYFIHIVVPAVKLDTEALRARECAHIAEEVAAHCGKFRLFSAAQNDGRRRVCSVLTHLRELSARIITHTHPAALYRVFPHRAFNCGEYVPAVHGLTHRGDFRRLKDALAHGRAPRKSGARLTAAELHVLYKHVIFKLERKSLAQYISRAGTLADRGKTVRPRDVSALSLLDVAIRGRYKFSARKNA